MRLNRAYIDQALVPGKPFDLPESVAAHWLRVLRMRVGDSAIVFNGSGSEADVVLRSLDKRHATVEVVAIRDGIAESPFRITLLQGVARGEKMDMILQKATELGVHAFVPVFSDRSEVKLDGERAAKRLQHWRGVVVAACEQSWRSYLPAVSSPVSLRAACAALDSRQRLILDPEANDATRNALPADATDCVIAVGPEGGWSAMDLGVLQAADFKGVRLGPRILRTETAGIAAIAALQSHYGDLV